VEPVAHAQPEHAAAALTLTQSFPVVPGIEAESLDAAFSQGAAGPALTPEPGPDEATLKASALMHQAVSASSSGATPAMDVAGVNHSAAATAIAHVSTAPQVVEPNPYEVRFSQADPTAEPTAEPDPTMPLTDEAEAAEDEVFQPLPDTDAEAEEPDESGAPEAPSEDDLLELEETPSLDDDTIDPLPDPTPGLTEGAGLIPADGVLDQYPYLDPHPNPLLLPTQPEEVEIIGAQPLTLEEAIELAYRNNPDLRVVLLELEQSQAALREAQANYYPTVSVNGSLQGQNTTDTSSALVPDPGGGFTFETDTSESLGAALSANVDVAYNLYSSGRREASIQAAEEQVQLNRLEVERRQEELRLNTANEYYDLQAAIEAIRISQAFLEEAERNLRDTRLREEVGVGTRFDVLRAEVQVANARQDLVNSERARLVAQRVLARRLNLPPSLTITTVPVDIAGSWPLDLEESIVLAYQNRAELEQQLIQRDISEQLQRVELAALGPQVDLFANYRISDILTQENSFNDSYQFGARVSWTLFDGGAAQARARQRELEGEIAERNFEETRNTVRLNVESAYFNLQSNLTNIDTARLAVEQAQEALDLAILRFDAGVGTQLDILSAQSELTDAEVNLVQAILGYNRSLAELNRAVSNLPEPYYEPLPY
jgi:outer membrane protein TolC